MRRLLSLLLALILLLACTGCFWGVDRDRRGYDDRDRGGHDGYKPDDRRYHNDRR